MGQRQSVAPGVERTERGLVIAGTRTTLYQIMDYLLAGDPHEEIRRWLLLTDQQLDGALAYIGAHRADMEAAYEQVVREAEEERRYWEERNRERFAQIAAMPPPPGKEAIWAKLQAAKAKRAADP